jgi:hypothetical protein
MSDDKSSPLARRRLFAGAGAVGAVAAVAAVAPRLLPAEPQKVAEAPPAVDPAGGYQVTEHVLRYYQTARV